MLFRVTSSNVIRGGGGGGGGGSGVGSSSGATLAHDGDNHASSAGAGGSDSGSLGRMLFSESLSSTDTTVTMTATTTTSPSRSLTPMPHPYPYKGGGVDQVVAHVDDGKGYRGGGLDDTDPKLDRQDLNERLVYVDRELAKVKPFARVGVEEARRKQVSLEARAKTLRKCLRHLPDVPNLKRDVEDLEARLANAMACKVDNR